MVLGLSTAAASAAHPELKAFAPAQPGMERFVIVLPPEEGGVEDGLRVELIVGKDMMTDGVNVVRLASTIEARTLQGWGYTYYEVSGGLQTMSTLMAPPEGAPLVKAFVSASPLHIRYNSRLPIVVYVPQGFQVRYRIWSASDTTYDAERG
jgi:ecotin